MFRLRKRAFSERRQWRVCCRGDYETDRFDALNPLYLCVVDRSTLIGSLRILPTTGPYMLRDVFPQLLGGATAPSDPCIMEISRLCVDREGARHLGPSGRREVTQILLSSLFRALGGQGIHTLLGVYDLQVGRVLSRVGCRPKAIGPICTMDRGLRTVAGQFTVEEVVRVFRPVCRLTKLWHGFHVRRRLSGSRWRYHRPQLASATHAMSADVFRCNS